MPDNQPANQPSQPVPPAMTFKQYLIYSCVTVVLGGGVSFLIARATAKPAITDAVNDNSTRDLIAQKVKTAATQQNPIVGEIRTFAFGGERNENNIEELRALGWLECAGQFISRSASTQELFDKLNHDQTWGKSGGRIRVPDLRGMFLRGWKHGADDKADLDIQTRVIPDGSSRTNKNSVGTKQSDAFMDHTHEQSVSSSPGGEVNYGTLGTSLHGDLHTNLHTFGADSTGRFGAETHPRNVYVLYCIYVGHAIGPNDIDYGDTPNN